MYILINKNTNKANHISDKKFTFYSDNLILAEVDNIPEKYDYLTAENIREETKTYTETLEEYDANGEIVAKEVEMSKTYVTCDLKPCFREVKESKLEALNHFKEIERSKKIVNLIRKKYSIDEELAILRQKESKPEKFIEYFSFAEECVKSVPKSN